LTNVRENVIFVSMKALIVEDTKVQAHTTADHLSRCGFRCDIAYDGETGLEKLVTNGYGIALVDVKLPKRSGIEIVREARRLKVKPPIIILSVIDTVESKVRGLDAGADDYLAKPFSEEELRARIDAVLRRNRETRRLEPLTFDTLTLDPVGGRVTRGDRKIFLSKLEFDLLEYLLRHQGCTVSKRTILSEIWDYKAAMNDHVVEMGVCSLRKKINWTGERKIIDTVRGLGYVIG
jgi:DNA-binding response OmpR family regulator